MAVRNALTWGEGAFCLTKTGGTWMKEDEEKPRFPPSKYSGVDTLEIPPRSLRSSTAEVAVFHPAGFQPSLAYCSLKRYFQIDAASLGRRWRAGSVLRSIWTLQPAVAVRL